MMKYTRYTWPTWLLCLVPGLILGLALVRADQTKLDPSQVKRTVTVIEWAECNIPPDQPSNCSGMIQVRFRYTDGTTALYVGIPSWPAVEKSTSWTWKSLDN